ncbi:type II toxin-antitoxin system VapC family toxin [bacterium]|nr:type II toxin-antitoxin system VapC family toxin [bacterium]
MTNDMNIKYLLDTNIVSHFIKNTGRVYSKITSLPMSELGISAITEGELLFGLAKKPEATQLKMLVHELLIRIDVLPWDSTITGCYGTLRANMQSKGHILGNLDMLIAAHALALNLVLITNDRAFSQVEGLKTEDWI